jgi:hypothetical protein
VIRISNILK